METETKPPRPGDINPYAAPRAAADAEGNAAAPAFDLTRDEVRIFVGKKNTYYWRVWQRGAAKGGGLVLGFNWAAFLFNLFWLLYRKLYRAFWIGVGATIAGTIVLTFLTRLSGPKGNDGLDTVVELAVAATVGTLGNGLYLRHARRAIGAVRAEEADPARQMQLLASRGGTSLLWVLVAIAGSLALGAVLPH